MTDFDPYKAPNAALERSGGEPTGMAVTESMLDSLKQTRPWVIFLSVLGFIGAAFMALAALVMLGMALAGSAFGGGASEALPLAVGIGGAALYLVLAMMYVYPCVSLMRYGVAIGRIQMAGVSSIEDALMYQKSFWRTIGIMTLVIFGLYVVAILVATVVAAVMGASAAI